MSFFVLGFFTGLSLIFAIGAQNIFVIEQGLKKQFVFIVCLICAISDFLLIFIGVLFYVVTVILSLFEQTYLNYMLALIFLGLGWNFLFISGTSLLVTCYKEEEKFKSQGINDFIVFTTMALASLSAGIVLTLTSWATMNLLCIPFLVLIVYSSFRADMLSKK